MPNHDSLVFFFFLIPNHLSTPPRKKTSKTLTRNAIRAAQLTPPAPPGATLHKGYLTLPTSYTSSTPSFELRVSGFRPRHVASHPYTGQRTVALARGPLVYCAEDVDNPWAPPHFRDVAIAIGDGTVREDPTARIAVQAPTPACGVWRRPGPDGSVIKGGPEAGEGDGEEAGQMQVAEERYVALRCDAWVRDLGSWRDKRAGAQPGLDLDVGGEGEGEGEGDGDGSGSGRKEELVLIPYYLRANRGGKGHMRVGMLRK